MYHQEKGEAFSATAPYLSLGGTEQSTRWRNPMQEWEIEQEGTSEQKDKEVDEIRREEAA